MAVFKLYHKIWGIVNPKYSKKARSFRVYKDALKNTKGIEIGGPSRIFTDKGNLPLYRIIDQLDGCNYSAKTVWEGEIKPGLNYQFYKGKIGNQFIAEASDLSQIPSEHYDFLLSSHCLEHCANPLKTLEEWKRVVKPNGYLLIVVPHRKGTFDHQRNVTPLEHMIEDFRNDTKENDLTHLDEILKLHDFSRDKASGNFEYFKERSLKNLENRCLHHHVFDSLSFAKLLDYSQLEIIKADIKIPYHIIFLTRKVSNGVNNSIFLQKEYYAKLSPFGD